MSDSSKPSSSEGEIPSEVEKRITEAPAQPADLAEALRAAGDISKIKPEKVGEKKKIDEPITEESPPLKRRKAGVRARAMAAAGLLFMADQMTGGNVTRKATDYVFPPKAKASVSASAEPGKDNHELRSAVSEAQHTLDQDPAMKEKKESNPREYLLALCGLVGTITFLKPIGRKLWIDYKKARRKKKGESEPEEKEHEHISFREYLFVIASLVTTMLAVDSKTRNEILGELGESAKTLGIMGGMVAYGEGVNIDLEKAYSSWVSQKEGKKEGKESEPAKMDIRDKIAVIAMTASMLSPLVTTIGSSAIISKMSNDLADEVANMSVNKDPEFQANLRKDIMAVCQSHVSNLSGFLLFGDPPFLALVEEYGFGNAIKIQMQSGAVPYLISLAGSVLAMNGVVDKALGREAPLRQRGKECFDSVWNNLGFLGALMKESATNLVKNVPGLKQSEQGLNFDFVTVLKQKASGAAKFLTGKEVFSEKEAEEEFKQEIHEFNAKEKKAKEEPEPLPNETDPKTKAFKEIVQKIEIIEGKQSPKSVKELYTKLTNIERLGKGVGDTLKDIFNVLPLQMLSVPAIKLLSQFAFKFILEPALAAALPAGTPFNVAKEMAVFIFTMGLSAFADNYVACKVGISLLPEKPHIAFLASLHGGTVLPISNTANMAQFSMDKFSLLDSASRFGWNAKNAAFSAVYGVVVGFFVNYGLDRKVGIHE